MPGEGDYTSTVREEETSTVNGDKAKPVRRFTWQELSQLNEPHNAHVAVRGKVDLYTVTILVIKINTNIYRSIIIIIIVLKYIDKNNYIYILVKKPF